MEQLNADGLPYSGHAGMEGLPYDERLKIVIRYLKESGYHGIIKQWRDKNYFVIRAVTCE